MSRQCPLPRLQLHGPLRTSHPGLGPGSCAAKRSAGSNSCLHVKQVSCVLQHASSSLAGRLWLLSYFLLYDACLATRASVVKQCLFLACTYRCQGMAYALTSVSGWHSWPWPWLGLCSFKLLSDHIYLSVQFQTSKAVHIMVHRENDHGPVRNTTGSPSRV
jgi:hypothetical protein